MTGLEDRLSSYFDQYDQAAAGSETTAGSDTPLDKVRRTAQRRSRRNRLALGACALLALAGAASVVPTPNERSALVVADEPDHDPTTEPTSTQVSEPAAVPTPIQPSRLSNTWTLMGDGEGGFAGLIYQSVDSISTSVDGLRWSEHPVPWSEPGTRRYIADLTRSGGHFVATTSESATFSNNYQLVDPRVIISHDLNSWQRIDLDLDLDAYEAEGLQWRSWVMGTAVAGSRVLVAVGVQPEVDNAALDLNETELCGSSNDTNGFKVTLCNGDVVDIISGEDRSRLRLNDPFRYFLSEDGKDFVEVDGPPFDDFAHLVSIDDEFGLIPIVDGPVLRSADGRTWTQGHELATTEAPRVAASNTTEMLVISESTTLSAALSGDPVRSADQLTPATITEFLTQLVDKNGVHPGRLQLTLANHQLTTAPEVASGPAGWAIYLTKNRPRYESTADGLPGWSVTLGSWQVVRQEGAENLVAYSDSTAEAYFYGSPTGSRNPTLVPPGVTKGFFGGYRLVRHGSDEVFEISGAQILKSRGFTDTAAATLLSEFDGRIYEHDGWRIEGNPVSGPLTLTRPDGSATVFDDGFAFTNGDPSDGVESDRYAQRGIGSGGSALRFYDASGNLEFEVATTEFLDVMYAGAEPPHTPADATDVDADSTDNDDETTRWVFFSPDGINWEILWQSDDDSFAGAALAVGDGEVLLLDRGRIEHIPLEE